MSRVQRIGYLAVVVVSLTGWSAGAEWKPAEGPLRTRWAKDVSPTNALPEYPRPQMVRSEWKSLNGLWQFAAAKEGEEPPVGRDLSEQILVPYPVESALSGIMRHEARMWYRRTFDVPPEWMGRHVLLHLDAVDWEATVYLNGKKLATHRGGYDAFGFDVTGFLKKEGPQELIVGVWDPTDQGSQPRGKQVLKPGGIMYTPASGIWQTVWIEPVNPKFIEGLHLVPDVDAGTVSIAVNVPAVKASDQITADVSFSNNAEGKSSAFSASSSGPANKPLVISIKNPTLWSPEHPSLYTLHVKLTSGGKVSDEVDGYFAMRKISLGKDQNGLTRILLNNQFVFEVGPLDQGFWPDGIYTAPTDEALKFDIETEKKLGFNMVRKHVKVEPERWYYWADKLGLLVWQDMPAGDNKTDEAKKQFEHELDRMVHGRWNHPAIIMWVVFNEGWGQFDTERLVEHVKQLDPSRLVNDASGWTDKNVGDVHDMHKYPDPGMPKPEEHRAAVLGEFGGLGLAIRGHMWMNKNWQYRGARDQDSLTDQYVRALARAWKLKDKGLCACVYTQTTDVETESNGLLTYDREVFKVHPEQAREANEGHAVLVEPIVKALVPTSQDQPQKWRYSFDKSAGEWFAAQFDDSAWKEGDGGFGTEGTPGASVHTRWNTGDIWLRRHFDLPAGNRSDVQLMLHHDEDAEVYLNGVLAAKEADYVTEYQQVSIRKKALAALKEGDNVIAIHCHQTTGGQYIDAGLVEVLEGRPQLEHAAP